MELKEKFFLKVTWIGGRPFVYKHFADGRKTRMYRQQVQMEVEAGLIDDAELVAFCNKKKKQKAEVDKWKLAEQLAEKERMEKEKNKGELRAGSPELYEYLRGMMNLNKGLI